MRYLICAKCGDGFGTLVRQGEDYVHSDCRVAARQHERWNRQKMRFDGGGKVERPAWWLRFWLWLRSLFKNGAEVEQKEARQSH